MKTVRCAIYTRKSSEEGLEQAFNSLDAQREACAAFIASQKHEGWVLLPGHYDDGGVSGGTLARPGLQRLLGDIDEGLVDQIVVYKIDRLTRSLADFAKLVERLDAAKASFVSVTQSFNTATSMGRLTLNVLLSFAQFEREVTAERIRDKIAASKKKGLWMGGNVPLGYAPDGRTLKIREDEAQTVRTLYDLYLAHRSIVAVKEEAERTGLRRRPGSTKRNSRAQAETTGTRDVSFDRGHIHYILTNPVYAGRIRHRSEIHEGQHPAIIEPEKWERVQAMLMDGAARKRGAIASSANGSPLAGKLFDETGDRLTPSHANKQGRRYRYYVSSRLVTSNGRAKDAEAAGGCWRLPAMALEQQLAAAVLAHLGKTLPSGLLIDPSAVAIAQANACLRAKVSMDRHSGSAGLLACVAKASIKPGSVAVTLAPPAVGRLLETDPTALNQEAKIFSVPFQYRKRGAETKLVIGEQVPVGINVILVQNIAKALRCFEAIKHGQTFEDLAETENVSTRRIRQLIDLAFLAPDIVKSIVQGSQPAGLTCEWLLRNPLLPDWQEQRRAVASL
jgi:DNA invertase Pin-like site-specific DNA recombinase